MKFFFLLHSSWPLAVLAFICSVSLSSTSYVVAFFASPQAVFDNTRSRRYNPLSMTQDSNNSGDNNDPLKDDATPDENDNKRKFLNKNVIIDELSYHVNKFRLEEANTKRLLRRKPVKLPYALSQKWIQQNWGIKTKAEFEQLVMDGDLKNVYISKRPEEYYGERGEWISWDHYLLGSGVGLARNNTESNLKWQ